MRILFFFLAVLFLASCSTYSKKECESMNWGQQGADWARKGGSLSGLKSHLGEECEKEHGVVASVSPLEEGYKAGLKDFCAPQNAAAFASQGGQYKGTCAELNESAFLVKYHTARETYLLGQVAQLKRQISSLESENSSLKSQISNLQSDLSSCQR